MGTKKQHYVPQLHLRRFALHDGRLAVFDKANSQVRWLTPEQTGHENHFLTIPELDGADGSGAFFELLFGKAEETAAPAIQDVIDRLQLGVVEVISAQTREILSSFLALQYLRTRAARDRNAQMRDAFQTGNGGSSRRGDARVPALD